MSIYALMFDGSCYPNPGVGAGAAVLLYDRITPEPRLHTWEQLGNNITNNEAEYLGLICGLKGVLELLQKNKRKITQLEIYGDSELIIKHTTGIFEVKAEHLKPYCAEAKSLIKTLRARGVAVILTHVKRDLNKVADILSKDGLKNARVKFESINLETQTSKVTISIDDLNNRTVVTNDDLKVLRVPNTSDTYTNMKSEELTSHFSDDDFLNIINYVTFTKIVPLNVLFSRCLPSILRWKLRGLNLDLAIRKVCNDVLHFTAIEEKKPTKKLVLKKEKVA